ncbi:MAG TPA: RNA 2',3'-cyclic phosphodiesterase [Thermoanaerobaculia bacterium]|nr:RNA 2',3'-cyclic phosphodiesterase [Thermoanaerobaculia bacterium]
MIRTFVAVPVEDAVVRRRLAGARSLLPELRGVRWTAERQLHFTLKFLGDLEAERLADARQATAAAAHRGPGSFRLALEGLGAFPPRGAARVVWAGCGSGATELASLAGTVEEAFEAAGFPREERPFSPHLTLARVRDPLSGRRLAQALPSVPGEPFGTVVVGSIVLYRSDLSPAGPEYSELLRVALESNAAPQ